MVRLYFVQIVHGQSYARAAEANYQALDPDTLDRDSIYFTDSSGTLVSAAVMKSGWRLIVKPSLVKNPERLYQQLVAILPVDKGRFDGAMARRENPNAETAVAFHVSDTDAVKLKALKEDGILLSTDKWRFYPGGELAAQALGFVGYSNTSTSTKTGVYGLEKQWQKTLERGGGGIYVNPFAEIFTNLRAAVSSEPTAHTGSVVTSIEPSVQRELEKTLDTVMTTYRPRLAGGIVMDPRTGEIFALAQRPTFDPNNYGASDPSVFQNALVEGRYELGSIMKPITMAAAIDSGKVSPQTAYNDTGCVERSTYTLCNFDHKARGVVRVQEVLSQSLNVGATFLADTMGYGTLTKYFKAFGLGEKTRIDLPGEVKGDLSPLGEGNAPAVNYDTAAFGQGIAVSPIAITRALAALGNGGVLPNPHVVTGVKYESGIMREIEVPESTRVISTSTSETITDMLIKVFDSGLLNGELKMEHYTIAAKTGTAQLPKTGGGYLGGDQYLHSFFGYFPAKQPRFIVFLFTIQPQGQKYASATLARPFADIAKYLINYYSLPPDR